MVERKRGRTIRRRVRDVYGNWVWQEEADVATVSSSSRVNGESDYGVEEFARKAAKKKEVGNEDNLTSLDQQRHEDEETISLDWRDYIALTIASLQTVLLPVVIFILVVLGIVIALALVR